MASRTAVRVVFYLGLAAGLAPRADAQWQIQSKDGKTDVKLGFLAQPQGEWLQTPEGDHYSQNLFLRRFRILFGGNLSEHWSFFFETDSPNLGKSNPDATANPTGAKDAGNIYVQDFFVTYSHSDAFKVEAGEMLLPTARNHLQGAFSLLPVDYGPYTFLATGPLQERVGRDYGVQLRGYPAKQHLEYRLGLAQGLRGVAARNSLRVYGRVVYYPWSAETGYFYAGTFQGQRRQLGFGASFDVQRSYESYAGDLFYEQPIQGGKQGVTLQGNWMRFDGGSFIPSLPKQDTFLLEAAFHFDKGRFSPFVQYAVRSFAASKTPDQNNLQVGLAWWMKGHNRNLKASVGRQHTDGLPDRTQALLQLQIFYF